MTDSTVMMATEKNLLYSVDGREATENTCDRAKVYLDNCHCHLNRMIPCDDDDKGEKGLSS